MSNIYKMKYNKYVNKLDNIQNVYYHFNSYDRPISEKYTMMLNILSNFINIKRATEQKYNEVKNKIISLTTDYNTKYKLTIGYLYTVITLLTDNSIVTITITDENTCYIQTLYGNNVELLNVLQELCKEFGLSKIETFINNQSEIDFLINNQFIVNKNRYLEYVFN